MKETTLTRATREIIDIKLRILDDFIEDNLEPLTTIGNPEKLIGKKYEEWTPADLQLLSKVYGEGDDTPLSKLIFKNEYDKVKKLESEVI